MCTKFHESVVCSFDFIGGGPTSPPPSPPQAADGQKRPGLVELKLISPKSSIADARLGSNHHYSIIAEFWFIQEPYKSILFS